MQADQLRVGTNIVWSAEAVHWVEGNTSRADKGQGREDSVVATARLARNSGQEQSPGDCFDSDYSVRRQSSAQMGEWSLNSSCSRQSWW